MGKERLSVFRRPQQLHSKLVPLSPDKLPKGIIMNFPNISSNYMDAPIRVDYRDFDPPPKQHRSKQSSQSAAIDKRAGLTPTTPTANIEHSNMPHRSPKATKTESKQSPKSKLSTKSKHSSKSIACVQVLNIASSSSVVQQSSQQPTPDIPSSNSTTELSYLNKNYGNFLTITPRRKDCNQITNVANNSIYLMDSSSSPIKQKHFQIYNLMENETSFGEADTLKIGSNGDSLHGYGKFQQILSEDKVDISPPLEFHGGKTRGGSGYFPRGRSGRQQQHVKSGATKDYTIAV